MINRPLFFFKVLSVFAAVSVCLVPFGDAQSDATPGTEPWTSRTPWGDPDLQGVWASDSATPMERPRALADREFLSDEEVILLQRRAAELFDGETDAAFGDSVYQAVLNEAETFVSTDTTGNYNQFWLIDRWFENRTSLIIDPSDGRIPPLTIEAQARQAALRAERENGRRDSELPGGPEDFNAGLRCTGGRVPMTGRGYNSNYQIVQSPGFVVINMEMMHDARIIPLDGRPHASSNIRSNLGDSRGHWEGNTLVVETTNLKAGGREIGASTGEHLRLIERFSRVNASSLRYEFTVGTLVVPFIVMVSWTNLVSQLVSPSTSMVRAPTPTGSPSSLVEEETI